MGELARITGRPLWWSKRYHVELPREPHRRRVVKACWECWGLRRVLGSQARMVPVYRWRVYVPVGFVLGPKPRRGC